MWTTNNTVTILQLFHVSEVCLYVILINTLAFNRAVRDESPWSHPICILQGDPTCNDISY